MMGVERVPLEAMGMDRAFDSEGCGRLVVVDIGELGFDRETVVVQSALSFCFE